MSNVNNDPFAALAAAGKNKEQNVMGLATPTAEEDKGKSPVPTSKSKDSVKSRSKTSTVSSKKDETPLLETFLKKNESKNVELVRMHAEHHKKLKRLGLVSGIPITSILANILSDFFSDYDELIEKYIKDNL